MVTCVHMVAHARKVRSSASQLWFALQIGKSQQACLPPSSYTCVQRKGIHWQGRALTRMYKGNGRAYTGKDVHWQGCTKATEGRTLARLTPSTRINDTHFALYYQGRASWHRRCQEKNPSKHTCMSGLQSVCLSACLSVCMHA